MTNEADAALVAAARAGASAAFGALVDRHQQAVRAFLRRLAFDPAEADDLAQETFLAAWERLSSFREQASVRSWLCGIAWKKAKGARRSWFRGAARDGAYEAQAALERPECGSPEDRLALEKALSGLPLEQRACVALCLGGELSHADAALALGLPLGTVKSHVTRGRARLLDLLGGRP